MKTTNVLAIALAALLVCGQAQATSITAVGLDTSTGGSWRTTSVAKPLDIDSNNVYGSAGYIAFATGQHFQGGNLVSPLTNPDLVSALPVWAPLTLTGLNSSYSAPYGNFDNPAAPGVIESGFAWDTAVPASVNTELLQLTVGTVGTFRLGVIQNGAGNVVNSFTLQSGAASATVNVNKLGPDDGVFRYALFDVTANPGDVLSLQIFSTTGTTGNPVGISGLTFDLRPVPEPSSLILAGLALVGCVGVGIRRRRAAALMD